MRFFLNQCLIVFKKEWKDSLRDRRSLRMAFLPPLYFVGIFVASTLFAIYLKNEVNSTADEPINLSVVGAENLPALINWLEEQGINVIGAGDEAYSDVQQKKLDFAVIIPAAAQQQFATGESVELWLVFDATNNKIHGNLSFIRHQIGTWSSRIGSLRLLERGISPTIANPISMREINVASDEKMGIFVMATLPLFLILSIFIGSVGFAADMTAGERERRSLESLLVTPARSLTIILGKWLSCFILTLAVLLTELILLVLAFSILPFNQLGFRVDVSVLDLGAIFVILIPLAALAVALQLSAAIFARSFKDAQTLLGIIIFIPSLPMIYTLINPGAFTGWMMWVPILGHQMTIKELLVGGVLSMGTFIQLWLPTVIISACLIQFCSNQLRKPRIVYG